MWKAIIFKVQVYKRAAKNCKDLESDGFESNQDVRALLIVANPDDNDNDYNGGDDNEEELLD
ncbi:hypothetical protein EW026_g4881 [Hermanssonia centrifuga]|nr:hypothetical protein EW026_g4881 [Hermanssonia centrifuga]